MNARLYSLSTLVAALVGVACTTTVPETGRKQFNMLPATKEASLGLTVGQ